MVLRVNFCLWQLWCRRWLFGWCWCWWVGVGLIEVSGNSVEVGADDGFLVGVGEILLWWFVL
jgi:hypothetical protein